MKPPPNVMTVARHSLLPVFLFYLLISLLNAQDSESIPVDLKVVKKTLENGLTYFIRENKKPENRASFRLVVNTGSMMETDEQRGLAHFIEHMAFNGTEHFKKQELVDYLESIGMRFGADLNAYTSFDETVYMLELPMDDPEILAKGFQVLEDWAHLINFNHEEIEKERGVIVEEWRLGRGAQGRIRDKQIPVLFHSSRYADRLPIGKVDIIKSAPRDQFLDYYRKWYRPNLMAVIAVGDFKTAEIEALIVKHFAHLKNPEEAPERILHPVPDHQETLFSIETDPEMPYAVVQISYKHTVSTQSTLQDYRRSLIESLYTTLLNQRLSEKIQQAEPPYLQAGVAKTQMVRSKDVVMQFAVLKEDRFQEGLKALLIEAARAERDGFTQTELDRAKADMLRMFERSYQERDKTNHGAYVAEYTRHFLNGESIPGIEKELEWVQGFLPDIHLSDVNQIAANWITENNRVILFSGPRKEGFKVPTESEILAVIREAESTVIEAYDDGISDAPILAEKPTPGQIVYTSELEELGLTIWTLSNGIRVLLKPTSYKNDQIIMQAFSPGGHSLVEDDLFVPASTADLVIGQSGLADFNLIQLRKMLAGKLVSVSASINEQSEGMRGSTSPSDLEAFFQLVYLTFTRPRADSEIFQSLKTRLREIVKNRLSDPKSVFDDAVEEALYGDHPRHQPMNVETLEAMNLEESFRIYQDRFADAGDFTFVFVGAFKLDQIKPFIQTYLASLPETDRIEKGRFINDTPKQGQVKVEVFKGIEPKSTVQLQFYGEAEWSMENRYAMRSVVDALRIRLRETLREDKGGVYGVGISGVLAREPKELYSCSISFGCDPDKTDELIDAAMEVVRKMQQEGPDEKIIKKIKETQLRGYEKGLKQNGYWTSVLSFYTENDLDFRNILNFKARVDALTPSAIQDAAKQYFSSKNILIAKLFPEKKPQ